MKFVIDDMSYKLIEKTLRENAYGIRPVSFPEDEHRVAYAEVWTELRNGECYGYCVGYIAREPTSFVGKYTLVMDVFQNPSERLAKVVSGLAA
jgi:hypothetical protein